jgi:hypothetical protein
MWLNLMLHGQSELHTVVREFTLLQLVQQIDELFDAIQGNLPIKLVSLTVLQNILGNVTLHLPDGYELIAGTKTEDIHQHYELTKVSVVAKVHDVKLIISVPLKTAISQFKIFKIFTLFSIRLNTTTLVFKAVSATTSCSQRQIIRIVVRAALPYIQPVHLYTARIYLPENQVYISRLLVNTGYATKICW